MRGPPDLDSLQVAAVGFGRGLAYRGQPRMAGDILLLAAPAPRARLTLLEHRVFPRTGTAVLQYEVVRS